MSIRRVWLVQTFDANGDVLRTKHYQTMRGALHFAAVCTQGSTPLGSDFRPASAARAEITPSFRVEFRDQPRFTYVDGVQTDHGWLGSSPTNPKDGNA